MNQTNLRTSLIQRIEEELARLALPEHPVSLYQPYAYALNVGGKRIRPLLTLLASGMCGGNIEKAMPAALAVEILHNFTLVHDDIMDSADTRRGQPSVFKKWNENVAILSGDVMFAGAMQQLNFYASEASYSKDEYAAMNRVFLDAIVTVCEGQALDMEFVDRERVQLTEYIEMISGKTAALLSRALEMGAIAAHASKAECANLATIGLEMGVAFQIQDDYLDATANPEKFGKKAGGDIYEGKKTYLTILALERGTLAQNKKIVQALNTSEPTENEVRDVLSIMDELNVFEDVYKEIQRLYAKSMALLDAFPDTDSKKELKNLLIFLQHRDH